MTNEMVERGNRIENMLKSERAIEQFKNTLPEHLKHEQFIERVMTHVRATPALAACDPQSIGSSSKKAAGLGLVPDGVLGQAYLIPYSGKAQLQIGYKGYLALAWRSDRTKSFYAEMVYSKDEFKLILGVAKNLIHIPYPGPESARGEVIGAYSVIQYVNGGFDFEFMATEQIEKIRKGSQGSKRAESPWNTATNEMYRKTLMNRLGKRVPVSIQIMTAATYDEYGEKGLQKHDDFTVPVEHRDVTGMDSGVTAADPTEHQDHDGKLDEKPAEKKKSVRSAEEVEPGPQSEPDAEFPEETEDEHVPTYAEGDTGDTGGLGF